ncbi:MAG TPA: spore gernimation protein [Bacillus bacterium]|nr:spore gernimation protein [Bacillus sp. (in: firmicutes)]
MNFYIQQSININLLKIGGISTSSVLQIGSAGIIKPASYLYNTGGFEGPAPEAQTGETIVSESPVFPAVPLQAPVPR